MKFFTSVAVLAPVTLLGSAMVLAQPAAPEQALRELNIMRNIFNAALQENRNRRIHIDGPDALYLSGQGMVFTFDMPGGNSLFNFNGGDFDFDFDYDDDSFSVSTNSNSNGAQAAQAQQAAQAAQVNVLGEYRSKLQQFSEQMRDKQEEMRDLQRDMREQQRAQQRAQQNSDDTDFNESEMERLGTEMEKLGDEINNLSNNMNQIQQEYQNERNTAMAELRQQQSALIFETLCNYGNTLRSLQSGEHVNVVLRSHEDDGTQVYVVEYGNLANCSSGSALQKAATSYTMPERNGF